MASNYTENYGLCQWEATDQVLRTEFNEDNQKVDTALSSLAQKTSDLETGLSKCGNCRIIYGSYTGSGQAGPSYPTSLTFDRKPLAVFVMAQINSSNTGNASLTMIRGAQWTFSFSRCSVTWSENGVSWYYSENNPQYQLSRGICYYIALLAED